jgi:hypothetical protein
MTPFVIAGSTRNPSPAPCLPTSEPGRTTPRRWIAAFAGMTGTELLA